MSCLQRHAHDGSKMEAAYCNWLLARQQAGEIRKYITHPTIQLYVEGKPWKQWKADFLVTELDGSTSVHECKGFNPSDANFRLKLNIFLRNYPDWPIFVNKVRVKFTPAGRIVLRPRKKRAWPKRIIQQFVKDSVIPGGKIGKKEWKKIRSFNSTLSRKLFR